MIICGEVTVTKTFYHIVLYYWELEMVKCEASILKKLSDVSIL